VLAGDRDSVLAVDSKILKINQLHPDLVIPLHVSNSANRAETGVSAFVSGKNLN
jgi:hypothetical protein